MSKNAKRTKCKVCKKRVNLEYSGERRRIRFFCPNCGSNGEVRFIKRRNLK